MSDERWRRAGRRCNCSAGHHQAHRGRCRCQSSWVKSQLCFFFSPPTRYGHGFEMFCLASDGATVVASACKVGVVKTVRRLLDYLCVIYQFVLFFLNLFHDFFFSRRPKQSTQPCCCGAPPPGGSCRCCPATPSPSPRWPSPRMVASCWPCLAIAPGRCGGGPHPPQAVQV